MKKLAFLVLLGLSSCGFIATGPPVGLPHCSAGETFHIRSLDFVGQYEYSGCQPLDGGAGD